MFFCCQSASQSNLNVGVSTLSNKLDTAQKLARDAKITAIVLGLLTLFLFAASYVLYGIGTLSPTALMGLGMFPYLGGVLFNFVGLGLLCGAFIFALIYQVKTCEVEKRLTPL